jgi:hypothetical protein
MIDVKLIDDYWVIGSNKWDASIYPQEQAEKYSKTLINCQNCINCSSCRSCRDCSNCSDCRDCSYSSYCRDCSNCSSCRSCNSCSDFKTNPQRITSSFLGSRNSQTTYYWDDKREQIICGCFKGTLEEFEEQVKITHGDNDFAKGYFKWIELVRMYKGGQL